MKKFKYDHEIKAARLPVAIPMGEHKMMYLPGSIGKSRKHKGFGVFVKNQGDFKTDGMPANTSELFKVATNVATFEFKNKTAINTFIQMLEKFRDYEFNKTSEQIKGENNEQQ